MHLALRPLGLRLTQYSVLVHLGSAPQALLELAERLEMDRTTLTRSLRRRAHAMSDASTSPAAG